MRKKWIFWFLGISLMGWLWLGCESNSLNPPGKGSLVVVRFVNESASLPSGKGTGFPLRILNQSAGSGAGKLARAVAQNEITGGKVVFFDLGIDWETLEQNLQDSVIMRQVEDFYSNMPPVTSFEQYVSLREQYVKIITRNVGGIEKQGELEIANGMARGMFLLTEGLKSASIGLLEGGNLLYVGDADQFEAHSGDTTYAYFYLQYTGPISLEILSPQDGDSLYDRVANVSGELRAGQNASFYDMEIKMLVNGEYQQKINADYNGLFYTTALLTRRTNSLQVSVKDTRTGQTASQTIQVQFLGDFPYLRAALSWDGFADLDLHMVSPDSLDCSALQPDIGGMFLDVGNNYAYGPESISLLQPTTGEYQVYVENRSQATGITATVTIFRYNPNTDREEIIDTQTHLFNTTGNWMVGSYQP